jgi:ATP-binding cassette subfamily C (CFTR/MRP) protein 1
LISCVTIVINYDKIVVLDSGRVLEYDTPAKLLANPTSTFSSLAREAGLAE